MQQLKLTLKETFNHWSEQNPSRMGASLSYFAIVSMIPLLLILITLAGNIFNSDTVINNLLNEISGIAGNDITTYIGQIIRSQATNSVSLVTAIISFSILLFGATGVFKELSYSMEKMWSLHPDKKPRRIKGLKQIITAIKSHMPILALIAILTLLFMISIITGISLQVVGNYVQAFSPNA
ncbi:MAG: hypothetical protein RL641_581, partial [Candidatus Parcubacteria bacterium]